MAFVGVGRPVFLLVGGRSLGGHHTKDQQVERCGKFGFNNMSVVHFVPLRKSNCNLIFSYIGLVSGVNAGIVSIPYMWHQVSHCLLFFGVGQHCLTMFDSFLRGKA